MALRLYRRHRKECEAGHPEDFKSGDCEEGRRGWKRCGCPIHASGTIRGKFKRQSTGQWEWDAARSRRHPTGEHGDVVRVAPVPRQNSNRLEIREVLTVKSELVFAIKAGSQSPENKG